MPPTPTTAPDVAPDIAPDVARRLDLALALGREVGETSLRYFQRHDLAVELKGDGSPVTEADKLAESIIRRRLAREFPDDAILGEEEGELPGRSGFRWIIDPIDGTRPFTRGIPTFGNLIGIEFVATEKPRVVAGVANFPALHELFWGAEGAGAWWQSPRTDPVRLRVSRQRALAEAVVDSLSPQSFLKAERWRTFEHLSRSTRRLRSWSDAYSFALVAAGRIEGAVDFGAKIWDVSPFGIIVKEAGGRITCWHGTDSLTTGTYVASNAILHDELLGIVA